MLLMAVSSDPSPHLALSSVRLPGFQKQRNHLCDPEGEILCESLGSVLAKNPYVERGNVILVMRISRAV